MARPVVSFDLVEARVSAGGAAVYVADDDEAEFARAVDGLLEDSEARRQMGALGRARVEDVLSWQESRRKLVAFYDRLLARQLTSQPRAGVVRVDHRWLELAARWPGDAVHDHEAKLLSATVVVVHVAAHVRLDGREVGPRSGHHAHLEVAR